MKCICYNCKKEFDRKLSEVKRNKKLKRKTFCSRKCSGTIGIANIPEDKKQWSHLPKGSQKDEYSDFKWYLRTARFRAKKKSKEFSISLQDLREQWMLQKGICPYTGWKLTNSESNKSPQRASLDRKDSEKGYTKENIHFISLIAQYAKNEWKEDVIYYFAKSINEQKRS